MNTKVIRSVGKAVVDRAVTGQAGRFRALSAAFVTGSAAAVVTYRLLRGGGDSDESDDSDD
jgi:hypothetical protein